MKWHGGDLECHSHQHQEYTCVKKCGKLESVKGKKFRNLADVELTGSAIDQSHAHQEETRGKRAHQKIFEGGFI